MKRLIWVVAVVAFLGGCSRYYAKNMNLLSLGMSKPDVFEVLGEPESTSAAGKTEYLRYSFIGDGAFEAYFVKLISGKVASYGKLGDFDSTKDPTLNVNLNKGK